MTDILTNFSGGGGGGLMYSSGNDTGPRGVSALHRRADQLKRWEEREAQFRNEQKNILNIDEIRRRQTKPKIKFSNKTLFLASCAFNDYDEIDRLLSNNLVNINDCNIDGLTALHQACIDDNLEMVEYLIKRGADVNCCDNEGWTPLHATASCGHTSIVRLLLENGANPTLVNNDGELALDVVDNDSIEEMITAKLKELNIDDYESLRKQEQILMMQDVNEWIKNGVVDDKPHPRTNATILHVAASKGYINIISKLLNDKTIRSQVNVDAVDNEGWTPLAAAIYFQQPGSVELLLQKSANIEHKISTGQSIMDLTDHELILRLLTERKKLLDEQKLKAQMSNGPQGKVIPQSPPSVPTPNESETQRRAHARRVRETRRSTQGITADDVKEAMDQLKQSNQIIATTTTSSLTALSSPNPITTTATTTTTVMTTPSTNTLSPSSQTNTSNSISLNDNASTITTIYTPVVTSTVTATSTIITINSTKPSGTTTISTNALNSPLVNSTDENGKNDVVDGLPNIIVNDSTTKQELKVPTIVEPSLGADNSTNEQNSNLVRRKRNKRRSTGTNPYDAVKGETFAETTSEEDSSKTQNGEVINNTLTTTPLSGTNRVLNNKVINNNEENKYPSTTTTTSSTTGSNLQRLRHKQLSFDSKDDKDYKKLYEDLLEQHDLIKKEINKKEQEWNREKRQMQRKIGELEEECKQLDNFRTDNQRLKDENSALIRVISKLSK